MTRNEILYQQNLETNRANVAKETEAHRSNVANETETNRANVARETETHRANTASEWETARANRAKEAENTRSAMAKEAISWADLGEKQRSNKANEAIGRRNATVNELNASTNRINASTNMQNAQTRQDELEETIRSNEANEEIRSEANEIADALNNIRSNQALWQSFDAGQQRDLNQYIADLNAQISREQINQRNLEMVVDNVSGIIQALIRRGGNKNGKKTELTGWKAKIEELRKLIR